MKQSRSWARKVQGFRPQFRPLTVAGEAERRAEGGSRTQEERAFLRNEFRAPSRQSWNPGAQSVPASPDRLEGGTPNCGLGTTVKQARRAHGFTLLGLLVVLTVIIILFFLLKPSIHKPGSAKRVKCVNNLKNMGLAFRTFAADHDDCPPSWFLTNKNGSRAIYSPSTWTVRHFLSISNELTTWKLLNCPSDTRKEPKPNEALTSRNISYFVAPDVQPGAAEDFLFGDRNLVTNGVVVAPGVAHIRKSDTNAWGKLGHKSQGNVVQADGSVQMYSSSALSAAIRRGHEESFRLVIP